MVSAARDPNLDRISVNPLFEGPPGGATGTRHDMADDLTKRGSPDRDRIDVNEEWELRDWSQKFGVSPDELKRAVQQVGDRAEAVRQHLGK